jgi:hypothetical protein
VEELQLQGEPEKYSLREALEQQRLRFDITSIIILDEEVPSNTLQPFVTNNAPQGTNGAPT